MLERDRVFDSIFSLKPIRPAEKERINPAYCNITALGQFIPVSSVKYIWILTQKNEVIIGIEKPWEYPEAFLDMHNSEQRELWELIQFQLKAGIEEVEESDDTSASSLGHPTMAIKFDNVTGKVLEDSCVLGGDLYFDNEKWIINNRSGRFGRKNEKGVENQRNVEAMLFAAALQFETLGLSVRPLLYFHRVDPLFTSTILGGSTKELIAIEQTTTYSCF